MVSLGCQWVSRDFRESVYRNGSVWCGNAVEKKKEGAMMSTSLLLSQASGHLYLPQKGSHSRTGASSQRNEGKRRIKVKKGSR